MSRQPLMKPEQLAEIKQRCEAAMRVAGEYSKDIPEFQPPAEQKGSVELLPAEDCDCEPTDWRCPHKKTP